MVILLFAATFGLTCATTVTSKVNSNALLKAGKAGYAANSLFSGITSALIFYIFGGFKFNMNRLTWLYALVYAVVCIISVTINLKAYRIMSIVLLSFINRTVSLVLSSLIGTFVFHETFEIANAFRIIIMFAVVLINFWDYLKTKSEEKQKAGILPILSVIALMFVNNAVNTIVTRSFARNPSVTDNNSFCLATNLFMTVFSALWVLALFITCKKDEFEKIKGVPKNQLLWIPLNNLLSNLQSLVSLGLMALTSLVVISTVSQALGVIATFIASFIMREKFNNKVTLIISLCLSVISIMIH